MPPHSSIVDAAASIAADYGLGDAYLMERLSGGTTQENYLLRAGAGDFVIRSYVTRSADYVEFEIDALRQLAAARFQCQRPIPNLQGQFISKHEKKPLAVFQYIEGERDFATHNHVQVASAVARMHTLSQPMRFASSPYRERYDQRSCLQAAEANVRLHASGLKSSGSLDWLQAEVRNLVLPEELPVGLCHCDLNPSNFLYRNGALTAVLDFDMSARTNLLYDVANLLYWWANPAMDAEHWASRAQEALLAYQELRPLTPQEKSHLYDMLKLVLLMSIAWFIHLPEETASDRRSLAALNELGRLGFLERLFGSTAQLGQTQSSA